MNFVTPVPLSGGQLQRNVRQYQYYPANYDYNQQYQNGYGPYGQQHMGGQYPYPAYNPYNSQNSQYGQNQQVTNDICDDRALQDKGLNELLQYILNQPAQSSQGPKQGPQGPQQRPQGPLQFPPQSPVRPQLMRPPQRQQSGIAAFFGLIRMLIRDFFGDKSFGGGMVNKSTGNPSTCYEVKSFIDAEYQKFQQNPQGYANQVQGYPNQGQADYGQQNWNYGQYEYIQGYGTYGGQNQYDPYYGYGG